jgi:hypothetical protein
MSAASLSFAPRYMPKPEPQYISRVAAGEHVDHISRRDEFDYRSPAASPVPQDHAIFSEGALSLLNHFLDALLYNFLGKARSTSLTKLRTAIKEVLKARLARDALASADEDVQDLIDEADVELEDNGHAATGSPAFYLEEVFKAMRLRIMVFIKLGEFDEEDEYQYLEEDDDSIDLSLLHGPTAVFIASVLEYLAERLLDTAGEAAWVRTRNRLARRTPTIRESRELELDGDRIIVEETDVEKIALNPTLGRLWRTWRKNYRLITSSSATSLQASTSSQAATGSLQSLRSVRRGSQDHSTGGDQTRHHADDRHLTLEEVPEGEVSEHDIAANIPLPMTHNDINEIEVPGLAPEMFDEGQERPAEEAEREQWLPPRPNSALFARISEEEVSPPALTRLRSNSAPHLTIPSSFSVAAKEENAEKVRQDPEEMKKEGDDTKSENATATEDGNENRGIVAGVLTGAATLVTSAVATIAGTSKEEEKEVLTPAVHDGLRSHPVEPRDSQKVLADPSALTEAPRQKRYGFAPPKGTPPVYEDTELHEDEEDVHAIGVARTSNVKIHSPSPSIDQNAFYYNGPAQAVEQARDARASMDRNGAQRMYDEYDLAKRDQPTTTVRYQSPLREASHPGQAPSPDRISSLRSVEKAQQSGPQATSHPTTYSYNQPPRSSQGSLHSTNDRNGSSKESVTATTASRGQKVPPLQTSFEEKKKDDPARPPSSTYSARSSATTPRSARGSNSSTAPRGLARERVSDEQRERDFDALIATSDTKVFSLTPEHLRDRRLDEVSLTFSASSSTMTVHLNYMSHLIVGYGHNFPILYSG